MEYGCFSCHLASSKKCSLFPPSVLSDSLVDCCCGYKPSIEGTKLGEPWYFESERVLGPKDLHTLYEFMRVGY